MSATATQPQSLDQIRTVNYHLRTALDQVTEGVLITEATPLDGSGPRVVYANRGSAKMIGFRPDELSGVPLGKLFDEAQLSEFLSTLPRVAEVGKVFQTRGQLHCRDGGLRQCRWTVSCIRHASGQALNFLITLHDEAPGHDSVPVPSLATSPLTVNTVADPAKLNRQARLEMLETLAGGLAHNFKNMLQPALGVLDLIENTTVAQTLVHSSPEAAHLLSSARESLVQGADVAKVMMDLAKGGEPKFSVVDVNKQLRDCVRLSLAGSGCQGLFDIEAALWPVNADSRQLHQVFNNLLINAKQAMPGGGYISVSAQNVNLGGNADLVRVGDMNVKPGPYVEITIHDRGTGMKPEILASLFKQAITTKSTGNGFGLISCHLIIKNHGGAITVKSTLGLGTEFKIYLPACEDGVAPIVNKPEGVIVRPGSGKILIVDDEPHIRLVVREIVKTLGYTADEVSSGEAAIDLYREHLHTEEPYLMVLMDQTLAGGCSGDEACLRLREIHPQARVIAASGYYEEGETNTCLKKGYIDVLPKPFTLQQLSSVFERVRRIEF